MVVGTKRVLIFLNVFSSNDASGCFTPCPLLTPTGTLTTGSITTSLSGVCAIETGSILLTISSVVIWLVTAIGTCDSTLLISSLRTDFGATIFSIDLTLSTVLSTALPVSFSTSAATSSMTVGLSVK